MPGYIIDDAGTVRSTLESTSIPLGIIEDEGIPLAPPVSYRSGDLDLLLHRWGCRSDGPDGQMFGIERTLDVIRSTRGESACEIVRAIEGANRRFELPERRHDVHGGGIKVL